MNWKLFILALVIFPVFTQAQSKEGKYTKADTLRGSLNENRDWWDVLRYDIEVKPDYESKTIQGKVQILFQGAKDEKFKKKFTASLLLKDTLRMQIDLQQPLVIDSILCDSSHLIGHLHGPMRDTLVGRRKVKFQQLDNCIIFDKNQGSYMGKLDSITIYYHGKPREAKNAPWDGGWVWTKDSLGRPWMSAAVQGLGASAWYPCKDYQGDEPDDGASLTIIVPDTLVAVGNGRLTSTINDSFNTDTLTAFVADTGILYRKYIWTVKNPINNYNIIPYIGKYVNWTDTLRSEDFVKGSTIDPNIFDTIHYPTTLDLSFWVLDYNLEKANQQFQQVKPMLRCFEYWFGPYPFYEDGYKLVDAPYLGMEHQSAVAYGNGYKNGYHGRDLSGTGWGLKWDFIIIHESGHEWFGNNITTKDVADMWVHEGFTNYSETLYTEWLFGKQAGDEYNFGIRKNIKNDIPIIGPYGVNKEGSGDMYYKAGNMIHIIRKVINDDEKFRQILRGLNATFRHQTVTTQQIEKYIIKQSGINFQKTFDQYLRTIQVPQLEFYFSKDRKTVFYRWTNCVASFDLPLVINNKRSNITTKWNSARLTNNDLSYWNASEIEKLYYITAKQVTKP